VFALEHGLSSEQVDELQHAVRMSIAHDRPRYKHYLPWAVYAAEIGYGYAGEEYWQTFEKVTPGWLSHGDRDTIRAFFRAFARDYGGAVPSGTWAQQFTIICWPITHAVLPKDLQRHMARVLYDLRYRLVADVLDSPIALGKLIADRSWTASSRFANFAQEPSFVGQIASALLLPSGSSSDHLIHHAALDRIAQDLEHEREARAWLGRARSSARTRVQLVGLARTGSGVGRATARDAETRAVVASLGIEPRAVLRPTAADRHAWEVLLEVPDLTRVIQHLPSSGEVLAGSRCEVAGAAGSPRARGFFLHGPQRVKLKRWPSATEVLLQFERHDPDLEALLSVEALLRPGSTRILRVASDGLAYEQRSLMVRSGQAYVLLRTDRPLDPGGVGEQVRIDCQGVYGALLVLPRVIQPALAERLRGLGIAGTRRVEVWPAGLCALEWDGDGYGEWPISEMPCIAVCCDHAVQTIRVAVDGCPGLSCDIQPVEAGVPSFVELPRLATGRYTVHFHSRSGPGEQLQPMGDLVVRVRDTPVQLSGTNPHGALQMEISLPRPSLDQLWLGKVDVALRGPAGRGVVCRVSLRDREGAEPTFATRLPGLALPVAADTWRDAFEKHVGRSGKAQAAYETAWSCEVLFSSEELGVAELTCEREMVPLRWAARRDGQSRTLCLLDDTGATAQVVVGRVRFEEPCTEVPFDLSGAVTVTDNGGMYVARQADFAAAVVAVPLKVGSFDALSCTPHISPGPRSDEAVVSALEWAALWGGARLLGDPVSAHHQRCVLLTIARHLFRLFCGRKWAEAEAALADGRGSMSPLFAAMPSRLISAVRPLVASDIGDRGASSLRQRVLRIAEVARNFGLVERPQPMPKRLHAQSRDAGAPVSIDEWYTEFALRLASDPANAAGWARGRLRKGVARCLVRPELAMLARAVVLAVDHHLGTTSPSDALYAGWRWT